MPIEDIDYLFDNAAQDSHVIYVDSNKRDRKLYPKANSMSIRFSHPLKNVYGLDILDASVPSAMFNIDYDTNDIYYFTSPNGSDYGALERIIREIGETPGMHSILNYQAPIDEVAEDSITNNVYNLEFVEGSSFPDDVFGGKTTLHPFVLDDPLLTPTPRVDLTRLLAVDDAFDGWLSSDTQTSKYLEITKVPMPDVVLYDQPSLGNSASMFRLDVDNQQYHVDLADPVGKMFAEFVLCFNAKYGSRSVPDHLYNRYNHPKRIRAFSVQNVSGSTYKWNYYVVTALSQAAASVAQPNLSIWHTRVRPGNYEVNGLLEVLDQMLGVAGIGIDPECKNTIQLYPHVRLVSDRPFVLNMETSSLSDVLGFDEYPVTTENPKYTAIALRAHPQLFGSKVANDGKFFVAGPGLINLVNLRYTVLRCDELEDHMYGSYTFGSFTPGIGLFRFFDVNSQNHQRQDYVNFEKRPFHPIGKLDKLTLQFVLPDGKTLYDFKGLNYFLVLSIRYYVPHQTQKIERSILNPNYDRNFQTYMYTHNMKRIEDGGASSEDEDVDGGELRSQLLQIQSKYDYESGSE